jgi:hypothetical protein
MKYRTSDEYEVGTEVRVLKNPVPYRTPVHPPKPYPYRTRTVLAVP